MGPKNSKEFPLRERLSQTIIFEAIRQKGIEKKETHSVLVGALTPVWKMGFNLFFLTGLRPEIWEKIIQGHTWEENVDTPYSRYMEREKFRSWIKGMEDCPFPVKLNSLKKAFEIPETTKAETMYLISIFQWIIEAEKAKIPLEGIFLVLDEGYKVHARDPIIRMKWMAFLTFLYNKITLPFCDRMIQDARPFLDWWDGEALRKLNHEEREKYFRVANELSNIIDVEIPYRKLIKSKK